ncbi:hypothetical protein EU545_05705 [Candidatus Thorarchaeota archaeon]|nr:MAG: hypothetical protein EU545_05705 [Candidatus Thorarchaeota archaeon]
MRYARGILIGALLPGIILGGAALIKMAGLGVTDPAALQTLWSIFQIWIASSVAVLLAPIIVTYIKYRDLFREILIFEAGGLAFFFPLWFALFTDLSGESWVTVVRYGIDDALVFLGSDGSLIGVDVGPIILIPLLLASLVIGLILLRPSFIEEYSGYTPSVSPSEEPPTPETGPSVVTEMPEVGRPVPTENTIAEMRRLLQSLSVPPTAIEAIIESDIKTVTDLVATSARQIAEITGMNVQAASDLQVAIQKHVWYGGI